MPCAGQVRVSPDLSRRVRPEQRTAIGAPGPGEKAHHYLRRFWLRLPPRGRIGIFDRTWYGRVLVERVEKFAKKNEWQRAYREINEFERAITDDGMVLVKFWVHISKKEQLDRFKKREKDPWKNWKLTCRRPASALLRRSSNSTKV